MDYSLDLVADSTVKGRIYPALAQHQARPYTPGWREFGQHWPYTIPLRLQEYCDHHGVKLRIHSIKNFPAHSFYPVCLGFFDFDIDYFALLPLSVMQAVQQSQLQILFYYNEGDNPRRIKNRLDALTAAHGLPQHSYVFVSANTAADQLPGFVTFHDFELWYYQRNVNVVPCQIHRTSRSYEFTCVNRMHKWWRATAMADLHRNGVLDRSLWSYCEPAVGDDSDCPIEVDLISQLRHARSKFVTQVPRYCDDLSNAERNNHSTVVPYLFTDAYCNIVLESQFDVDQSGGAFVTEKTFKPIKHGQLFFVAGGAGSLQALRDLGYQTFDDILDNSYDRETNATRRWQMLLQSIMAVQAHLPALFERALPQIQHNQQLFQAMKTQRLNTLIQKIHEQSR